MICFMFIGIVFNFVSLAIDAGFGGCASILAACMWAFGTASLHQLVEQPTLAMGRVLRTAPRYYGHFDPRSIRLCTSAISATMPGVFVECGAFDGRRSASANSSRRAWVGEE